MFETEPAQIWIFTNPLKTPLKKKNLELSPPPYCYWKSQVKIVVHRNICGAKQNENDWSSWGPSEQSPQNGSIKIVIQIAGRPKIPNRFELTEFTSSTQISSSKRGLISFQVSFGSWGFRRSPHLLHLFRRMLQHCFDTRKVLWTIFEFLCELILLRKQHQPSDLDQTFI